MLKPQGGRDLVLKRNLVEKEIIEIATSLEITQGRIQINQRDKKARQQVN